MYQVLKFGGTSMGSTQSLEAVINILKSKLNSDQPIVAAVSAMSKVTDTLLELAKEAKLKQFDPQKFETLKLRHLDTLNELAPKNDPSELEELFKQLQDALKNAVFINEIPTLAYMDYMASFGERLSASLLTSALKALNLYAKYVDARDFIISDGNFTNATIDYTQSQHQAKEYFNTHKADIYIVTGFIARTPEGQTTTLGRGGSDFTGGLLANFLEAKEVEIWTDVDGILSTDPRLVPDAKIIQTLSYREAFEVAYYGGKVLYPKTMEACLPKNVDIVIKNTFNPAAQGSRVTTETKSGIKVVSRVKKAIVVEVVLAAITSEYGLLGKIFSWFGEYKVTIDVVTTSGDSVSFSCDKEPSQSLINKIQEEIGEVTVWTDKEIIAIIGSNISNTHKYGQIIDLIKTSKPIMLSLNTKQTNLTAIVEAHQGEQLVRDIHAVIVEG